MKKRKYRWSVVIGTLLLLLTVGILDSDVIINAAQVNANKIFTSSASVGCKVNQSIPANLLINDQRKGVLLTAEESGATIDFSDTFSGNFEMDFRVFTDRVLSGADVAAKGFSMEPALNNLTLKITDVEDSENVFSIQVDATGSEIEGLPQARVIYDGKEAGLYYNVKFYWNGYKQTEDKLYNYNYEKYTSPHSATKLPNNEGLYTYISGTSFDNASWFEDTYVKDTDSIILGFDAQSMEVYVYSRGTKIVVWDLDQQMNGQKDSGFVLNGFDRYKVSLEFSSIAKGKTAKMMVYEVCGQSLSGADNGAPTIKSNMPNTAVVGDRITIDKPVIYDVLDKKILAGSVAVSVTDPDGADVVVDGLTESGTWKKDANFKVEKTGTYTVKLEVSDASGNVGTTNHSITVSETGAKSKFVFYHEPQDISIGKGMTLNLEKPYAVNEGYDQLTVKSEILFDGVIKQTEIGDGTLSYTFSEVGKHTVRYTIKETWEIKEFTVEVSDDLPVLEGLGNLNTVYMVNEEIVLPELKLTLNGEKFDVKTIVEFPDGTRYKNSQFIPEVPGSYKMIVTCEDIGYSYEAAFYVSNNADSLFSIISSATVTGDCVDPTSDQLEGVLITTNGAGMVSYNKAIDFSEKEEKYTFLKLKAAPESWNKQEMGDIVIKLTDINDENNYITLKLLADVDMENMSDVQTSAFGYPTKGLRGTTLMGNSWGTMIGHSFKKPAGYVSLAYDPTTQCIYANELLVADLDDAAHFTEAFTGFSDGKCQMTIETANVFTTTASLMVIEIDGMSLNGKAIVDRENPAVTVSYGGYLESAIPNALVGTNYKLFEASAFDKIDGAVEVSADVYFFKNNLRYLVDSSQEGFTPSREGTYLIVYSAKDSSGNVAEYEVPVKAVAQKVDITVGGTASKVTAKAGTTYTLPGVTASGGFGNLDITVKVTSPDNKRVEISNNKITLTKIGDYQIVYTAKDYNGQKKDFVITLTSEKNTKPIISLKGEMPEFIIAGEEYTFCDFSALDYSGNEVKEAKKQIVVTLNGKTQTLSGNTYTPEGISGNTGTLKVQFKGIGAEGESAVSHDITVIKLKNPDNQNYAILKNYFYGPKYSVQSGESLVYGTSESKASLKFVRPIVASDIYADFTLLSAAVTDSIKVTVRDSENSSEYFQVVFEKADDKVTARIVGDPTDTRYEVGGSFDGKENSFRIVYNERTGMLGASDAKTGATKDLGIVKNKPNGNAFEGFSSHKAYFEIQVGDLTGKALIRIDKVCNQVFSNQEEEDLTRPLVYVLGEYNMVNHKGDEIVIHEAVVSDVLSNATLSYSLSSPSKSVFKNKTDKAGYLLKIDQYGYYNLTYNVKDGAGMKGDLSIPLYSAYVGDIELKCPDVPSTIEVGTTLSFKDLKAVGDGMEISPIRAYTIIIDSEGVYRSVNKDKQSYTFNKAGKYTIRFYAVDEDANTVWKDFSVTVK